MRSPYLTPPAIITRWQPSHLCKQAVKQSAWITHFPPVWIFQVQRLIGFLGIITVFSDTVRAFCLEECKEVRVETLMELRNQSFRVYSSRKYVESINTPPSEISFLISQDRWLYFQFGFGRSLYWYDLPKQFKMIDQKVNGLEKWTISSAQEMEVHKWSLSNFDSNKMP